MQYLLTEHFFNTMQKWIKQQVRFNGKNNMNKQINFDNCYGGKVPGFISKGDKEGI